MISKATGNGVARALIRLSGPGVAVDYVILVGKDGEDPVSAAVHEGVLLTFTDGGAAAGAFACAGGGPAGILACGATGAAVGSKGGDALWGQIKGSFDPQNAN